MKFNLFYIRVYEFVFKITMFNDGLQKLAEATISAEGDALETETISQSLQMLAGKADKDGGHLREGENT